MAGRNTDLLRIAAFAGLLTTPALGKDSGGGGSGPKAIIGLGLAYSQGSTSVSGRNELQERKYYNLRFEGGSAALCIIGRNGVYAAAPLEFFNTISDERQAGSNYRLVKQTRVGIGGRLGYSGDHLVLLGEYVEGTGNSFSPDADPVLDPKFNYLQGSLILGLKLASGDTGDLSVVATGRHDRVRTGWRETEYVDAEMKVVTSGIMAHTSAPDAFKGIIDLFKGNGK